MTHATRRATLGLALLVIASALSGTPAAARVPIQNIPPTPHNAPAGTPLENIAMAIRMAAEELNWKISGEAPGEMRATLHIRTHDAVVKIGFDETQYWIDYEDSFNLDFKAAGTSPAQRPGPRRRRGNLETEFPQIHRNYNRWVEQLAKRIEIHTASPPAAEPERSKGEGSPLLIADELEKLDGLRQRGVLSQEEFDRQKAKLLSH